MSGELTGKQGDGIDISPLSPTLPDGSEAGLRCHPDSVHLGTEIVTAASSTSHQRGWLLLPKAN